MGVAVAPDVAADHAGLLVMRCVVGSVEGAQCERSRCLPPIGLGAIPVGGLPIPRPCSRPPLGRGIGSAAAVVAPKATACCADPRQRPPSRRTLPDAPLALLGGRERLAIPLDVGHLDALVTAYLIDQTDQLAGLVRITAQQCRALLDQGDVLVDE